ncbi:radical SAM protein [bacterium]|nr:radical SAM protein [candidate division CSSED10-310 bacterium]
MRIMLVNSPWICDDRRTSVKAGARWPHIRDRKKTLPYYPYPFAMAYAASVLKRAGHTVRMLDGVALELTGPAALKETIDWNPEMVILETSTPSIEVDLAFAREVAAGTGAMIVYSGPHATVLFADVLEHAPGTAVLRGEYDDTVVHLAGVIAGGGDLAEVTGIAWRDGDMIRVNSHRALITDLDSLPYPERDSLPMERYTDPACKKFPNVSMVTSRGCPHQCVFCLESTVFYHSPSFRPRNPERVVDEMEFVVDRFGAREVYFDDASFTASLPHARAVAEAMIRRGFRVPWSAMADARVDDDTLRLLKASGCIGLKFGVETADPERMAMINKHLDLDHVRRFVSTCHRLGIATHGTFMFGLPGETRASLHRTLEYARRLRCTTSQFSVATPFPGTPFYEEAVRKGWLITSDWSRWDGAGSPVLAYPDCTPDDILHALECARKMKIRILLTRPAVAIQYGVKLYRIKGWRGLFRELVAKTGYLLSRTRRSRDRFTDRCSEHSTDRSRERSSNGV